MKKRTKAISVLAVLAVSSVAVATSGCGDPPVLQSIEITTPPTARIYYIDNITGEGQNSTTREWWSRLLFRRIVESRYRLHVDSYQHV